MSEPEFPRESGKGPALEANGLTGGQLSHPQPDPPRAFVHRVLPGAMCCAVSIVLLVLSTTSRRLAFSTSEDGVALGFASEIGLDLDLRFLNNVTEIHLRWDAWTSDPGALGQLGRAYAAQVGLAAAAVVLLIPNGVLQALRLTPWLPSLHLASPFLRVLSTALATLSAVLCWCRPILAAALHHRALEALVEYLEDQVKEEVIAVGLWFPVFVDAGALVVQSILLAFAFRTAVGKRLERTCGTCCGCTLAAEDSFFEQPRAPTPAPARSPRQLELQGFPPALEYVFVTPRDTRPTAEFSSRSAEPHTR